MNENPVLYGIKDAAVSRDSASKFDSILFGKPIWLKQPNESDQRCSICSKSMRLLLQRETRLTVADLSIYFQSIVPSQIVKQIENYLFYFVFNILMKKKVGK